MNKECEVGTQRAYQIIRSGLFVRCRDARFKDVEPNVPFYHFSHQGTYPESGNIISGQPVIQEQSGH